MLSRQINTPGRAAAACRSSPPAVEQRRCCASLLFPRRQRQKPHQSPRALPDPEPGGAHHETDEAALLIRRASGTRASTSTSTSGAMPPSGRAARASGARWQVMGLDVTPELCAIATVYFVQGTLGLARLAVSYYFKDDLHLDPAQVALLTGVANAPWVVKPLYGFVSDAVPLFGYRRRSYLALCGLMGAASWAALALFVDGPAAAVAALLLGSLATAASDVVVDSIVVERARGAPEGTTGSLQSLCWGASAVGGVASAYFSGSLVRDFGVRAVFGATAAFPLLVSAAALLIDEACVGSGGGSSGSAAGGGGGHLLPVAAAAEEGGFDSGGSSSSSRPAKAALVAPMGGGSGGGDLLERLRKQGAALVAAITRRDILLPTAFVFLWQATPTADTAMFYFYSNKLHFDAEFLGRVRLAGALASLAGVALYNTYFKAVPLRRMLFWAMVVGAALGSTQLLLVSGANRALGLSDEIFVLGDSVILTALAQVSFMPVLVLAARMCPEGVEATLFATLMSVSNSGAFVGSALGAGLTAALGVTSTNFDRLLPLTALCVLSTLLPIPFLRLLPAALDSDADAAAAGRGGKDSGGGSDGGDGDGVERARLLDVDGGVELGPPPAGLARRTGSSGGGGQA